MTDDFTLSRRKTLAALGAIGASSAGAGLGTSAFFNDAERFENNRLTAGTLDMKVAATEFYSDGSADEAKHADVTADGDDLVLRFPPGEGQTDARTITIALDDADDASGFLDAITDPAGGAEYNTVNGGVRGAAETGLCGPGNDADGPVIVDVDDVKPGDFGGALFGFELCDNPGYVWLTGEPRAASENGVTEPEADDPDEDQVEGTGEPGLEGSDPDGETVELLDAIQVAYVDNTAAITPGTVGALAIRPATQQSLREFLATARTGVPLAPRSGSPGGWSGVLPRTQGDPVRHPRRPRLVAADRPRQPGAVGLGALRPRLLHRAVSAQRRRRPVLRADRPLSLRRRGRVDGG